MSRHTAFKITIRGDSFFIKAGTCMKRRSLVFNIIYCKFWFDGDFFVQNQDTSVELHQYQSLSQGNFFSLFYTEDFLPLLIFHEQRFFRKKEIPRVNFVN